MTYYTTTPSPVGELLLTSDGVALTGLYLNGATPPAGAVEDAARFGEVIAELARQSHARIEVTDEALAH